MSSLFPFRKLIKKKPNGHKTKIQSKKHTHRETTKPHVIVCSVCVVCDNVDNTQSFIGNSKQIKREIPKIKNTTTTALCDCGLSGLIGTGRLTYRNWIRLD